MLQRVNTAKAEEGWAAGKKKASTNSQELHLQEKLSLGIHSESVLAFSGFETGYDADSELLQQYLLHDVVMETQ